MTTNPPASKVDELFGSSQPLSIDAAAFKTGIEKPDFETGALIDEHGAAAVAH